MARRVLSAMLGASNPPGAPRRRGHKTMIRAMPSLSPALQVALLMTASNACAAGMNVTIRVLSEDLHPFEIAFFRNLFGFLCMLPFLGGIGLGMLRTRHAPRLLATGAAQVVSMLCFFSAIALMPLGQLTALAFTKPLFATIGAALILHEVVRARRWTAIAIGFVGVLIVVQPGAEPVPPAAALVLASTLIFAGIALAIKRLVMVERTHTIVLYQSLFTTVLCLPPALLTWVTPSLEALLLLALIGAFGTIGWLCFTHAFKLADASAIMPHEFVKLPLTAFLAFLLFAEVPTLWTWIGGAVIFGSTLYIAHREARVTRTDLAAVSTGGGVMAPPARPGA
jgi:drug/metabolite transporter (DMT)-like permease